MADAFKLLLNEGLVHLAGEHFHRVWPAFDLRHFEHLACAGLDALEFKARAQHICDALEATLPQDFDQAAQVLESALRPVGPDTELGALRSDADGLAGWIIWPMGEYVARRGQGHWPRAAQALHALTQRLTAEFAIRPFLIAQPDAVFATLHRWTRDPSMHVRRLVSEGSRPRLPWGLRLHALVRDPSPTLPLLRALQDDPSEYVRRSVANHLNDIAKDHPELVVDWLAEHLPKAPAPRLALLRHASRGLIKQGHADTLALWGLGQAFDGTLAWSISHDTVRVGDSLQLALELRSTSQQPQALEIDYVVHHQRAKGKISLKVFKGWRVKLDAGATLHLEKTHSMRTVTTRRYHPGEHVVELRINGQSLARVAFSLGID